MNKRLKIYREGHATVDGRLLKSTVWAPAPLPLLARSGSMERRIVGTVTNLRHDIKSGWVTGLLRSSQDFKGLYAGADFDQVERDEEESTESLLVFKGPRLRAVTLTDFPAWEGMDRV